MRYLPFILTTAGLAASCFSNSAFANFWNFDDDQLPAMGVYFGAMGGVNDLKLPSGTQSRTVGSNVYDFTTDNNKFTGNVHIGNLWNLDDNNVFGIGVEIGATYWGNYDFNSTGATTGSMSFDQETANILLGFDWNITQRLFIMPQAGVAFNIGTASGDLTSGGVDQTSGVRHKAVPLVGLNLGWNISPAFSVYLSGQELMADDFDKSYYDFDQRMIKSTAMMIGINYDIGP